MANIVGIREYVRQARDANGHVLPAGEEPAIAATALTATVTSAQHTFDVKTKFFLIHSENIINWEITADGNPTAVISGAGRMSSEEKQFLGLASGGRDDAGAATPLKIAIIIDT